MTTKAQTDALSSLFMRLRRRSSIFIPVFAAVATAVVALSLLLVPQYTATTAVLVVPDRSPIDQHNSGPENQSTDTAEIESQVEIIRSPRLIHAILTRSNVQDALERACRYDLAHSHFTWVTHYLGVAKAMWHDLFKRATDEPPCTFEGRAAVLNVTKSLSVSEVGRSRVISIVFQSSLPETAALVANALLEEYLTDNVASKSHARLVTAQWLESEGTKLHADLVQKEAQIDEYKRTHNLVRGQVGLVTQENLTSLVTQLGQAKAHVAEAEARLNEVRAAQKRGDNFANLPEVLSSMTIRSLRDREAQLSGQIGEMTTKYGPRYPRLISAQGELREIQASLASETRRIMASLQTELAGARVSQQRIEAALERAKGEAGTANDADSAVQSLVRDADIDRQLYLTFAGRAKELETETRAQNPSALLVNMAEVPVRPSFPQTMPFLVAALLLGSVVGSGAALLRDYTDKTLRSVDDLLKHDIPVLAHIPKERALLPNRRNFLAAVGRDPSLFREAIRALFAHLRLRSDALKVVLVTSSAPQEGKTSVCVALAHFAAVAGWRVLLVEADMRMPTFAQIMPVEGEGLEQYLRGSDLTPIAPIPTLPNFEVVPAGATATDSTELLSSECMLSLLKGARPEYDFIVIDTPPCNYLMDASILARWADGVVYVTKWGHSHPGLIDAGLRTIQEAGGKVVGVVIGMVEFKKYNRYGNTAALVKQTYVASSDR